jgi:hypothetical protein
MEAELTRITHKIAIQLHQRAVPFAVLAPGGQSGNFWINPRISEIFFTCIFQVPSVSSLKTRLHLQIQCTSFSGKYHPLCGFHVAGKMKMGKMANRGAADTSTPTQTRAASQTPSPQRHPDVWPLCKVPLQTSPLYGMSNFDYHKQPTAATQTFTKSRQRLQHCNQIVC